MIKCPPRLSHLLSYYFLLECAVLIREYTLKLFHNLAIFLPLVIFVVSLYALTLVEGRHQYYLQIIKKEALWCGYWVGLGMTHGWIQLKCFEWEWSRQS